ncbi:MAG: SDR family oxidoreductase [Alphaproteobacteria bacterium]|nr:MAG: SDR family oxidoreductase [Alphaproteobacteria bacterium]
MTPLPPPTRPAALVTGGAQRIGQALVHALVARGHPVAIHFHRSQQPARELATAITAAGGRAIALPADLGVEAEVAALIPEASATLGPIGVLVNNASSFERDDALTVTRASWDLHLEANLRAPFVLMQAMAAALPDPQTGVIINLIDQRVWALTPHFISYTVSKTGLWTLTQTMALALAPRIRVAAIGPGPTLANTRQDPAAFARQAAGVPLGQPTGVSEIAAAMGFILDTPSFTGQMLALDGGQHLGYAFPPPGTPVDE